MKTKIYFSLLSLVLTMSIFSCKDKDSSSTANPIIKDTKVYFNCKINKVNYVDETRFADYSFGTSRIVSHNEFQLIRFDFDDDTTGTYVFTPNSTTNIISYLDSNSKEYNSISGSLIITEYNKAGKVISGTFSGVLKCAVDNSQIILTDGKFNYVPLTQF